MFLIKIYKYCCKLKIITHPDVYEPSDDSYLMVEVLEKLDLKGRDILDIGTGTGILAIISAKKGANVIGCDINDKSIELARINGKLNNVKIEFVKSDLFENIHKKFDIIIFNPPYLPSDKKNFLTEDLIEKAWNDDGTIKRFFNAVENYLKRDGKFYIVLSSLTDISLNEYKKFEMRKVASKKFFFEEIFVIEGKIKYSI